MLKTQLKIEGRSGCRLEIINRKQGSIVRKSSASPEYNDRLFSQHLKQKKFLASRNSHSHFTAPTIIAHEHPGSGGLSSFDMEYIPGEKYSEFFERASVILLKDIIKDFIGFLDSEIRNAEYREPDIAVIKEKIGNLRVIIGRKKAHKDAFLKKLNELNAGIPREPLPMGFCHGDFTLSNMIFSDNRVYLVDFLDSFIESPVMDIVKLRQDTKFHWSLTIENDLASYQTGKIRQALQYFDDQIVGHFGKEPFYRAWYSFLEKINLLRIVPYLTEERELEFIEKCLR